MKPIVLLTDFGSGEFPGIMEAVIRAGGHRAPVIHLTHHVAPQNVRQAAFIVKKQIRFLPVNAVVVVVVDPTVGSNRRIVAAELEERTLIAPDNGFLTPFVDQIKKMAEIPVPDDVESGTFHGRDVFAPVAAKLASGSRLSLKKLDPKAIVRWNDFDPVRDGNLLTGRILHIDAFGNCISNIDRQMIGESKPVRTGIAGFSTGEIGTFYSQAGPGEPVALFSSYDTLEFAVVNGDFRTRFGVDFEQPVTVEFD